MLHFVLSNTPPEPVSDTAAALAAVVTAVTVLGQIADEVTFHDYLSPDSFLSGLKPPPVKASRTGLLRYEISTYKKYRFILIGTF
jgi:hypothetical protein